MWNFVVLNFGLVSIFSTISVIHCTCAYYWDRPCSSGFSIFLSCFFYSTVVLFSGSVSPCEHNGICRNTRGSFRCDCQKGYTGPRCEENINECQSNPCRNDGTCIDETGQFKCACMPGEWPLSVSDMNIAHLGSHCSYTCMSVLSFDRHSFCMEFQ